MRLTVDALFVEIRGLQRPDLERWISNAWVRPDGDPGHYLFREIDVARIRLIMELREYLEIEEPALPTVLSLLDQLYDMRRRLRGLNAALEETVPAEIRKRLLEKLDSEFNRQTPVI
jgi:chaperone modulatory protein CbpM